MTTEQRVADDERRRIGRERLAERKLARNRGRDGERRDWAHERRAQVWYDPRRPEWCSSAFVCGRQIDGANDGSEREIARDRYDTIGAEEARAPRLEVSIAEMVERAPVRVRKARRRVEAEGIEDGFSVWGLEDVEEMWEEVGKEAWGELEWEDEDDWGELLKDEDDT
ncbi:hypothetical protein K488DRAFT_88049 [Vararia minispora EC-137]|uniref:Uncharacterized protein n=1 Tax=Vararia minispora EC-137 TaxID=1314806 RepID=A0ACB8QFT1_9AGAM|nr:hypothetical protein K488DRAFT_88049 [Vararia minispora EC-137]